MTDYAPLWQHLLNRHGTASVQYKQASHVLSVLRDKHIALYRGDREAVLTSEAAKELQKLFEESGSRKEQQLRTRFVNNGLRVGARDLNWKISLLPREVSLKPEKAPFTPSTFTNLQLIRKLEQAFLRDLGAPLEKDCTTRLYGQVLLSAVLYGGMLHKDWVEACFRGLFDGVRVGEKFLWIEMRREFVIENVQDTGKGEKGSTVSIGRRWIADPLTEALLYRLREVLNHDGNSVHNFQVTPSEDAPPKAWGYLSSYLSQLGFGKSPLIIKSLHSLISTVRVRYGLYIPQALVGYATGESNAVSLSPAAWTRVMTGKSVPVARHTNNEAVADVQEPAKLPKSSNPSQHNMDVQEAILLEIREALYAPKGEGKERKYKSKPSHAFKTLNEVIQRRSAEMWPILSLIADWLLHLMAPSGTSESLGLRRQARQPSTAGRYLSAIGAVLLATGGNRNLAGMSSEELSDLYEDASEGKKSAEERRNAKVVMARFHYYLFNAFEMRWVNIPGIKGRGPIEATVDANLVTPDTFSKVLDVLGFHSDNVSRHREISLLLSILAFRCGLREGEARSLLLSDLQGNRAIELLIRPHEGFRPKSLSGTRRLPLTFLLPDDELKRLVAWRALRHKEGASPDNYLFTYAPGRGSPIYYEDAIEPVKMALRQVTCDQTLVFHHLRHSFATWLNLKLTLPLNICHWQKCGLVDNPEPNFPRISRRWQECGLVNAPEPNFPLKSRHWQECSLVDDPEFNLQKLYSLRRRLIGSCNASQQGSYAVTMLIGHSAPDITYLYYNHLMDWQLWVELADDLNAVALTEDALVEITGLSRAQIWRVRKSSNIANWTVAPHLPALRRKWGKLFTDPQATLAREPDTSPLPTNASSISISEDSAFSMPDWRVVQRILTICQRKSSRISQQSETKGIPRHKIWGWLLKAEEIADIETRKTKKPNSRKPRHIGTRKRLHKKPTSNNDRDDKIINIQAVSQDRFPSPPRIKSDIELVDRIFNHIRDMDSGTLRIISAGIIFFLFNYTVAKGGIRCWRVCQAKRYLEFIELLGVPKQLVRIVCYPPKGSSVFEQERGVQVWAEKLLLSPQQFTLTPYADEGRQDRGSICINVAATAEIHLISKVAATVAARKKEEKEEKYYKTPNSYGFRYAIYMFYIMYNW